jgi:hypothetical protein
VTVLDLTPVRVSVDVDVGDTHGDGWNVYMACWLGYGRGLPLCP